MDVKPIARKSIYEDIVLQIRGMIDRGELRRGDKLPPERRLAEMFSVSRNTVREAIKALAEQGLLESRQGAGTYVSDAEEEDFATSLAGAIVRMQPELRDVFEVRKMIEPEIAAMAARNATSEQVTRMEALLVEQARVIESGDSGGSFDLQLHSLFAEASGNQVLCAMVVALRDDFSESRSEGLQSPKRQEASLAAHRSIVDAIKGGHVMQAERAMRAHLEEVESIVFNGKI